MAGLRREDEGAPRIEAQPVPAAIGVACLEQALRDFTAATDPDKLAGKVGIFLLTERIADCHSGRVEARRFRLLPLLTAMKLDGQLSTFTSSKGPLRTIATIVEHLPPYRVGGRTYAVDGPNHKYGRMRLLYFEVVRRSEEDSNGGDAAAVNAIPPDLRARAVEAFQKHAPALALLLAVDPYPNGLWGFSLAPTTAAFRHTAADLGSITISLRALDALAQATKSSWWEDERRAFSSALDERRVKDRNLQSYGAVGMWLEKSQYAKGRSLAPHPRHTAIAARWWATSARAIDYLSAAVAYILQRAAPDGGWGDEGTAGDPLTTAYALRTLLDLDTTGDLASIATGASARATYAEDGFRWLHRNLLSEDGWWLLRTVEGVPPDQHPRVHYFTAEIAASLPEFPSRGPHYRDSYAAVLRNLAAAWTGAGIPLDKRTAQPDLGTTTAFIQATWFTRSHDLALAETSLNRYFDSLDVLLRKGTADAAAWAATLSLLSMLSDERLPEASTRKLKQAATEFLRSNDAMSIHRNAGKSPRWASRHIDTLVAARTPPA